MRVQLCLFSVSGKKRDLISKKIPDYSKFDEKAAVNFIKCFDFENVVFSKHVKDQGDAITKVLTDCFLQFCPLKTVCIKPRDQPWVNKYTRLLLRKKNRNYNFFKKVNFEVLHLVLTLRLSLVSGIKRRKLLKSAKVWLMHLTKQTEGLNKHFTIQLILQCTTTTFLQKRSSAF